MSKSREGRSQLVDLDLELYGHQREYFTDRGNKENHGYDFPRPLYSPLKHSGTLPPRPPRRKPVELDRPPKPVDLDAFSTSSISDDDNDIAAPPPRYTFYSTSDLTTSDSDIYGRFTKDRYQFRPRTMGVADKFPSLSTIYPDNSSNSFEDYAILDNRAGRKTQPDSPLKGDCDRMAMSQELSPVLPPPNLGEEGLRHTDEDLPPVMPPLQQRLQFTKFNPQQTSTLLSLHHHPMRLPKTNPRHSGVSSTPRHGMSARRRILTSYEAVDQQPVSLFEDLVGPAKPMMVRPEDYKLPSAIAKHKGIKGIVFLAITLSDSQHSHSTTVRVRVTNAALFLNKSAPLSTFVKVEIKPHNSYRKRSRKYDSRFKEYRTRVVPHTNRPQFDEEFRFKINRNNLKFRDRLGISMYSTNEDLLDREPPTRELLGCMTFSLSKLYDKFMDKQYGYDSAVKVCDEGYFLLNEIQGRETHMSENRIRHSKYYDEIGSSTMSTSSSIHSGSPLKMMGEPDWRMPMATTSRYGHLQHDVLTRLAVSPCKSLSTNNHASAGASHRVDFMAPSKESRKTIAGTKKAEKETGELDCTTSGSSSSNSGIDYKRRHRCTLPSITTTTTDSTVSDLSRSGASSGHFADVDYAYLYADGAPEPSDAATTSTLKPPSAFRTSSLATERITTKSHPSVRRVASFTYSPEESTDKHNKRGGSKKFLGPIGKTFNYIKSKVDSAISTSALYPTKEECRSWQDSFAALLNHKYGCYLFRQFLKEEFSDENLDFWLDCEEFKKLKEGKKAAQKASLIFATFVQDGSPKEVNLDSVTKAATKTALENGARPDMFALAQSRIEQLMEKDSYQRFLKSKQYNELLKLSSSQNSVASSAMSTASTSNGGMRGAFQDQSVSTTTTGSDSTVRRGSSDADATPTIAALQCRRYTTCVPDSGIPPAIAE